MRNSIKKSQKSAHSDQQVKVIEAINGGLSHCSATVKFGVDRTQIHNIILDQQTYSKCTLKVVMLRQNISPIGNYNTQKSKMKFGDFFVKLVVKTYQLMDLCC